MHNRYPRQNEAATQARELHELTLDRAWARWGRSLPPDLKDDCISESQLALWQATPRLQQLTLEESEPYVVACVQHAVLKVVRAEVRARRSCISLETLSADDGDFEPAAEQDTSEQALTGLELLQQIGRPEVAAALAGLTGPERELLDLAFGQELTDAEIAERRHVSAQAAKKQRQRAIGKLREHVPAR